MDSAFVDFSTGLISQNIENEINVYPNPSTGENIYFVFEAPALVHGTISLWVYDVNGKEVYQTELPGSPGFVLSIPLSNGTYIYKITDRQNFIRTGQLIIAQ